MDDAAILGAAVRLTRSGPRDGLPWRDLCTRVAADTGAALPHVTALVQTAAHTGRVLRWRDPRRPHRIMTGTEVTACATSAPKAPGRPPADPLDTAALAARLHAAGDRERRSLALVEQWLGEEPAAWVAWSGGKDSTVVADLAHRVRPGIPLVHYDSGLDFPENTAYLAQIAAARGWNYQSIRVGDGLAEMVANGTWDWAAEPGEARYWWTVCLGPAEQAHQRYGPALMWGLRADESIARRWALAPRAGVRRRQDGTTTYAPIWWWRRRDTFAYLHHRGIPANPLYARLAALGVPEAAQRVDVAVGSDGADRGRLVWLRRGWPDLWHRYQQVLPRLRELS